MFSATLSKEIRPICKKFMQNVGPSCLTRPSVFFYRVLHGWWRLIWQPLEIYVDDEAKLTLHGLQQHFVKIEEAAKNRKLNDLLDTLEFNQVSPAFWLCVVGTRLLTPHLTFPVPLGLYLCQIRFSCCSTWSAPSRLQFSINCYPLWSWTRRADCEIQTIQSVWETDLGESDCFSWRSSYNLVHHLFGWWVLGCHWYLWPRNRCRACQYCCQLWHAWRGRLLPSPSRVSAEGAVVSAFVYLYLSLPLPLSPLYKRFAFDLC